MGGSTAKTRVGCIISLKSVLQPQKELDWVGGNYEYFYLLLSANLHPSPACVRACWPAELFRTSRRFGAKGGLKPSQTRPKMDHKRSEYAP